MSRIETIEEPETLLSEQEWLEAKRVALQLVRGDQLDGPDAHLAYVRERIRAAWAAMWFDRWKVGAAAKEIADHLQLVENVRVLQTAQKELADALALLGARVREIEADMRILKAETKLESLKEAQSLVNAVQGGLNERIETLAVTVAQLDRKSDSRTKRLK